MKAWQGPGNEAGGCWWVYPWVTLYSMRALTSVLTYCDLCFMLILPELKGQCWGSSQVFLSQEGSSTQPSGGSRQTCTYVSCWLSQYMGGSLVTLWPKFFFSLFLCSASSLPPLLSLLTLSPSSVFLPSFLFPLLHSCSRGGERVGHIATDQKQLWQTFRAGGTHYQTQGTLSL